MTPTKAKNEYVLTVIDYFTKMVELFPLATKEAAGVSRCIKTFCSRYESTSGTIYVKLCLASLVSQVVSVDLLLIR